MTGIDEHLWYTRRAGHVRGPFPQRQISHYILLGRICGDDELSVDREHWHTLADLPHLIPDVMRNLETDEDRQRLQMARLRADERRGGDRRLGSERMRADTGERRRDSDRRQDEDEDILRHRELRRGILDAGRNVGTGPCGRQCRCVLFIVAALAVVTYAFTPDMPSERADCGMPAAEQVNWSNCKLPGLEADQANLRGALARNMDLTAAHLVAANLIGADLAYTTLNLADLRRADLSNARMTGAGLRSADLRGARLSGADMSYADLSAARLDGVMLSETRFDNAIWVDGRRCRPGSVDRCVLAQ